MMRIGLVEQGRNPLLLFYSSFRTYVRIKNLDALRLKTGLTKSFLCGKISISIKEVTIMFAIYQNCSTGEITFSHKEAVEMYRAGAEVAVLVDNGGDRLEQRALWVH